MSVLRTVLLFASLFMLAASVSSHGQTTITLFGQSPCPTQLILKNPARSSDLVCMVPQVYGPGGLVGSNNGGPLKQTSGHEAHFQASSVRSFSPVNAEIGIQISQLPIAPPVAGFLFAGVISPSNSFGPILTDRAETLGKGRGFVSLSYQYFNFDKADGVSLERFGTVFTHEPEPGVCTPTSSVLCLDGEPIYTRDVIATANRIDLKVNQLTIVGTYGITDKLDFSMAIPVLNVRMAVRSSATIYNFEPPPVNHEFDSSDLFNGQFSDSGYAFGVGDVTLRVKYLVHQREKSSFAAGMDFRLATGDDKNFLGAGTWGFRPFVIYTGRVRKVSPHATFAFQGNGESMLAGDVTSDPPRQAHLPDVVTYSAGADATIFGKVGFSADFIGQSLLHGSKITAATFTDFGGNVHPDINTVTDTINLASIAAGLKVNPYGSLLITLNGLFRLNDSGLHSKPAPLLGVSYTF